MAQKEDATDDIYEISQDNIKQSEDLMKKGVEFFNEKEYDKASKTFEKALTMQPNNPMTFYYLSLTHEKQREFALASDDILNAIEVDPSNYKYWELSGRICTKLKEYKMAGLALRTAKDILISNNDEGTIPEYYEFVCKKKVNVNGKKITIKEYLAEYDEDSFNWNKKQKKDMDLFVERNPDMAKHYEEFKTGENMIFLHAICDEGIINMQENLKINGVFHFSNERHYLDNKYILENINKTRHCWNVRIFEGAIDPMMNINKRKYHIKITDAIINGAIAWVNGGYMDGRVLNDMHRPFDAYGKPTAKQITNTIRKTIVFHRENRSGDIKRCYVPYSIVLSDNVDDQDFEQIADNLSEIGIKCFKANDVTKTIVFGDYDGIVLMV